MKSLSDCAKILFIGDVVGKPGRQFLQRRLGDLAREIGAELVIANGENSAGGLGINAKCAEELFGAGVDVITSGNHVWDKKEFLPYLNQNTTRIVRPMNYPSGVPGVGFCVVNLKDGTPVLILNAIGRVLMSELLVDCPFAVVDKFLMEQEVGSESVKIKILDFHAEATSEKLAMGFCFNGRLSAILGTHTHVQTADARILSHATAYISDVGMCGPWQSVIGMEVDNIVKRFRTALPTRFEVAKGSIVCGAVSLTFDKLTGKAVSIERLHLIEEQ